MEHLKMETPNGKDLNLDALYKIFPSCFTEAADDNGNVRKVVDWDKLRSLLGENVSEGAPETYDFTWVGKRAAKKDAAAPIRKTLRPCTEESVDWDTTKNLYIEGDNLEVLKLLQNSYMGKIKMIYIDPPYNTGNDFVYHDDFAMSTEEYADANRDEEGNKYRRNTDSNGRFHSDWCSMMYSRLLVARSLLKDDGVIFISIDDNEVRNLRNICDEIFGANSFIAMFIWDGGRKNDSKRVSISHEYIVAYMKRDVTTEENSFLWKERKEGIDEIYKTYDSLVKKNGTDWETTNIELKAWFSNLPDSSPAKAHKHYCNADDVGVYFASDLSGPDDGRKNRPRYQVLHPITGKPVVIPSRGWRWEESRMIEELKRNRVHFGKDETTVPNGKVYLKENEWQAPSSVFYKDRRAASSNLKKLMGDKIFDFPKDVTVIERLISFVCRNDDIVLDYFSGSATTAESVMNYNHKTNQSIRFILIQLQEKVKEDSRAEKSGYHTICDIGKERIRRAGQVIIQQSNLLNQASDTGMRVLKCDESNFKEVTLPPKDYSQEQLLELEDNIKDGRSSLDLLFDCMIRWGLELSLPFSSTKVCDCTIHNVNDGDLVACFDGQINPVVIDTIAAMSPLRVVFRDKSFSEAAEKMNLFELFKQKCNWTEEEVRNNVKVI